MNGATMLGEPFSAVIRAESCGTFCSSTCAIFSIRSRRLSPGSARQAGKAARAAATAASTSAGPARAISAVTVPVPG
jgi:hypothetical protein